jgi:NADH-quinone oxidoreductase subunit M
VIFGRLAKPSLAAIRDLGARECLILAPLVILTILLGVYPRPVLDMSAASVAALIDNYHHAIGGTKAAALGF